MATETKKVPKKVQKGAKKPQKAKMPKMQKVKIDPCSSPTPPQPKKLHNKRKKHHCMHRKAGLSKNQPKKHKNAIFAKPSNCRILKFCEVILLI